MPTSQCQSKVHLRLIQVITNIVRIQNCPYVIFVLIYIFLDIQKESVERVAMTV